MLLDALAMLPERPILRRLVQPDQLMLVSSAKIDSSKAVTQMLPRILAGEKGEGSQVVPAKLLISAELSSGGARGCSSSTPPTTACATPSATPNFRRFSDRRIKLGRMALEESLKREVSLSLRRGSSTLTHPLLATERVKYHVRSDIKARLVLEHVVVEVRLLEVDRVASLVSSGGLSMRRSRRSCSQPPASALQSFH